MAVNPYVQLVGRPAEPGLESVLAAVRLGAVPPSTVIAPLAGWPLLVLDQGDGRTPEPLLRRDADGTTVLVAFTSPDRIPADLLEGRRPIWLAGGVLAAGLADDVALWINQGSEPSLVLGSDILAGLGSARHEIDPQPNGSRPLTALESAIVRVRAGSGSAPEIAATARDADLMLLSATDPADGISPATMEAGGVRRVLVWTDRDLVRDSAGAGAAVMVRGDALSSLLGRPTAIVVDPGTGFAFGLEAGALDG